MKKIGILGGSFNPIHKGHIDLAMYALNTFKFDEVMLIPAKIPPHKSADNLVSESHRLKMCQLATENLPIKVSDIELKMEGASYSYRTLEKLKLEHPDWDLWLICGTDMFMSLLNWRYPERIFKSASIAGVRRQGDEFDDYDDMSKMKSKLEENGAKVEIGQADILEISSTYIRECVKNYIPLENYVDKNVIDYIYKNKLYR